MGGVTGKALISAVAAIACASASTLPAAAQTSKEDGSRYVQCDGMPNNMTAGETAARLLGAVTLLALFAPAPEAADPDKRKFGAEGVAVCTGLLEGDGREGNPERRLGLILARAVHHIEAKDYDAALSDVALARSETMAAGLMADPYFARSRGRAFDRLESEILLRKGDPVAAQVKGFETVPSIGFSITRLLGISDLHEWNREAVAGEDAYYARMTKLWPQLAFGKASRLEELGQFSEAAAVRDALVALDVSSTDDLRSSAILAQAALTHRLTGNAERATELAAAARANVAARKAAGKPETSESGIVEVLDLLMIVETADKGDLAAARRLFSARSQWVDASFGAVIEVNRRLRAGATPDELIGGLAKSPQTLWEERRDTGAATHFQKDGDNKTLFGMLPPLVPAAAYESMSKQVWNTAKSKLLIPADKKAKTPPKYELLWQYAANPQVAYEAYALHAALLAKSRGHKGFMIQPLLTENLFAARIRTGNPGDAGLPNEFYNDAETVIAELSPMIPSPEMLKARRAARNR